MPMEDTVPVVKMFPCFDSVSKFQFLSVDVQSSSNIVVFTRNHVIYIKFSFV